MEKKVHNLKVNRVLAAVMPPLQKLELELLTNSLMTEGCRDPLVVWNGTILDGHNRYRICQENQIPFTYVEMEFENEAAAKLWIIRNQLARRNLPDFVRCEMVMPLEEELRAAAEKRMLAGVKCGDNPGEKLPWGTGKTRDALAELAGISGRNFDKAKTLIEEADEEIKERLRSGQLSIHKAYTELKEKNKEKTNLVALTIPAAPLKHTGNQNLHGDSRQKQYSLLGTGPLPGQLPEGATYRMPDSVYDIPPIEVYGNMPSDDMAARGRLEMVHARSDLNTSIESFVRRAADVLRGMSPASCKDENLDEIMSMVYNCCDQIKALVEQKRALAQREVDLHPGQGAKIYEADQMSKIV